MIKFTKMHGLGNDYVYIDAINQKIENRSELAKYVSDRHFGIGSDGLILICESKVADFRMQMFNSDGTEAEMCGNGIRCVGKFVYDKGMTNKDVVTIETLAGIKLLKFTIKDGKVEKVRVDMGEPILEPEKIPVLSQENPVKNLNLKVEDKYFKFTCVSMGNPHAITFIDEDVKNFDVHKYGKIVEHRIVREEISNKDSKRYNLVFTKENGAYIGTDITRYPYKIIHNELGIKKCRFYDLRGSYATKILNNGIEIRDVADLLGHKNIETTENFYISSTESSRKYATELFDNISKSETINKIIEYKIESQ